MAGIKNKAAAKAFQTFLEGIGVPKILAKAAVNKLDFDQVFGSMLPGGSGSNANQSAQQALQDLTTEGKYDRSTLQKVGQDYIIPGVATATQAIGNILAQQYGLGGSILSRLAASGSNGRREQHGASLMDIAAGIGTPLSDVKSATAQIVGNSAAHLLNSAANRARANTLNDLESQRQRDMLLAYGDPNSGMSTGEYNWIQQMNAARKDAIAREAQNYDLPGYVSDERLKDIMSRQGKFTEEDAKYLAKLAGDMDEDHNFERDGNCWRDDILNKYAEHIQNFVYNYKPEAQSIDPTIDPDEKHIGPMAQDIEKVNPACIKETPEGVKTVDTGRLALMNAGAIAELAREVKEMKD